MTQSTTTRAIVLDEAGAPRWSRVPLPPLEPGAVRLRLRLCGLCGTDLHKLAHGGAGPGTVLGHELVGEVEAAGPGAAPRPGERVVVPHHRSCGTCDACRRDADPHCEAFRENLLRPGGFAERLLVAPRAVATVLRRIPDAMSDETAMFLEPAACVVRSVRAGGILDAPPDETDGRRVPPRVRVLGAGSVGLLHLAVVRALAPDAWISAVDPRADRRREALDFGADEALDLAAAEAGAAPGAHVVFDCVGGARALDAAVRAAAPRGRVVLFAHGGEGESAAFALNPFFKREISVVASYSAGRRDLDLSWDLLVAGRLRPARLVTDRLPLDAFAQGVERARRHAALKVAFVPAAGAG